VRFDGVGPETYRQTTRRFSFSARALDQNGGRGLGPQGDFDIDPNDPERTIVGSSSDYPVIRILVMLN
jgi:hypothetical protein